jgi:formate dehydrogenase iron-sulfur subunit
MNAVLVDVTRCTGCERCVAACGEANDLDAARAQIDRATTRDGLSANRLLALSRIGDGRFARKSCMHCLEPSCVSACLVGGLTKTPEGPVVYDPDKCIGCRYCMLACPFHVPRYEWAETNPFMVKCEMCFDRWQRGLQPACVEACPNDALMFGDRDTLLAEAHDRITARPDAYVQRVWGEHEFGGTSILSLTEPLITKTPLIGLGVACSLLGINWLIGRRMKLAAEAVEEIAHEQSDPARGANDE